MKTSIFIGSAICAIGLTCTACFRQEIRILDIQVPQMGGSNCVALIQNRLVGIEGVKTVLCDIEQRKVSVTYDSTKLAIRNIEFVVAGLGFQANDVPPKPEGQNTLPPECR